MRHHYRVPGCQHDGFASSEIPRNLFRHQLVLLAVVPKLAKTSIAPYARALDTQRTLAQGACVGTLLRRCVDIPLHACYVGDV